MDRLSKKLFKLKSTLNKMKSEISQMEVDHLDTDIRHLRNNSRSTSNFFKGEQLNEKVPKTFHSQKSSICLQKNHRANLNEDFQFDPYGPLTTTKHHSRIRTDLLNLNNLDNSNIKNINNSFLPKTNLYSKDRQNCSSYYLNTSTNYNGEQPVKVSDTKRTDNDIFLQRLEEISNKKNNKVYNSRLSSNGMIKQYKYEAKKCRSTTENSMYEGRTRCYYSFDTHQPTRRINSLLEDSKSILNMDNKKKVHNNCSNIDIYSNSHYDKVLTEIFKIYKMKPSHDSEKMIFDKNAIISRIGESYNISKNIEKYCLFFKDFCQNNFCGYNSCWSKNLNYNEEIFSYINKNKKKKNYLKRLILIYKNLSNRMSRLNNEINKNYNNKNSFDFDNIPIPTRLSHHHRHHKSKSSHRKNYLLNLDNQNDFQNPEKNIIYNTHDNINFNNYNNRVHKHNHRGKSYISKQFSSTSYFNNE